jgi:CheY-like chemotaxis protein/two-component sensor histidine kinase
VTGKLQLSRRLIDLASIAEASIEGVRAAAEAKDIAIELRRDAKATLVLGDPDRMQQVAWNLLFNAVKFTPQGGRVQVRIGRAEHHVHLTVTDSGQGITPAFLPHVFDRFRQGEGSPHRNQLGLGLGLTLVRHLVELHGGTVRAESPGERQGATFTVTLPIPAILMETAGVEAKEPARPAPSAREEVEPEPDPRVLDGVSVLVVEDEEDNRQALAAVLDRYGARVKVARSAGEAIDALEAAIPDVLVSDIGMPGADGYELIRRVRSLNPERGGNLPALALTAYAGERERRMAAEAGYQDFLVKPVAPPRLATTVARLARPLG